MARKKETEWEEIRAYIVDKQQIIGGGVDEGPKLELKCPKSMSTSRTAQIDSRRQQVTEVDMKTGEVVLVEEPPSIAGALALAPQAVSTPSTDVAKAGDESRARLMLAKGCPRDEDKALNAILKACKRSTLAERALYKLDFSGKPIIGPSVHLAKEMARHWGNFEHGVKILPDSPAGQSNCEAYAWDYETNSRAVFSFVVAHVRYTKKGGVQPINDTDSIFREISRQASKHVRNCIFDVIPSDIKDAAVEQCKATQVGAVATDKDALGKVVAAFAAWSITKEHIEKYLNKSLDDVQARDIVALRQVWTSIEEKEAALSDYFDVPKEEKVNPAAESVPEKPAPAEPPLVKAEPVEETPPEMPSLEGLFAKS